jgi:N utilization substance protein A
LTPAKIIRVEIDDENDQANVFIAKDERAKAVGKNGVNVNLASELTGYRISLIEVEPEVKAEIEEPQA